MVTCLYSKNYSKSKLVGFWDQSLVFHKAFMLLLIISPMLIVKPKNTKSFLWLIGFLPRATSKMTFRKNKTLHQINARNTYVAKYLWLYSLKQSTCPRVTRENYIAVGTNIWSYIQHLNPQLYLRLFWPSFWVLIILVDESVEINFTQSSVGWLKSLVTADFSW